MTTVSANFIIRASIEEVFAFVTDARNNVLWQSGAGLQSTMQEPEDAVGSAPASQRSGASWDGRSNRPAR